MLRLVTRRIPISCSRSQYCSRKQASPRLADMHILFDYRPLRWSMISPIIRVRTARRKLFKYGNNNVRTNWNPRSVFWSWMNSSGSVSQHLRIRVYNWVVTLNVSTLCSSDLRLLEVHDVRAKGRLTVYHPVPAKKEGRHPLPQHATYNNIYSL